MKIFKWQTEEKFLANMMLLSNGIFLVFTGYFFIIDGKISLAPTYELMTNLMPLEAWGAVMMVAGLLLSAAAFQVGNTRYLSMITGGLLGAAIVVLYAMASTQGAESYLVPVRYSLMACFNLLIAVLGGIEAWRIKKITSRG